MRVLFADDDPVARLLIRTVLESLGHEPVEAPTGSDAWAAWQRGREELVVLDLDMPELEGLEVCRRIRAEDSGRESFVLVLTGRDSDSDLAAVLDAGADDYLAKPATPEQLRARLVIAGRQIEMARGRRHAELELARARWLAGIGETTIALQHEINNPLSALLGHAELLQLDARDRGERSEAADVIVAQARRIADVVRRIAQLRDPRSVEYVGGSRMLDLGGSRRKDESE